MPARSAALLLYRRAPGGVEVLIGHMGGPFWARKDARGWSIPKGEYGPDEQPLAAARREFAEEMGSPPPAGDPLELGEVRLPGGKVVTTFALEGDFDVAGFASNTFTLEWPRGSGRLQEFPELDRAAWFPYDVATGKVTKGQVPILARLAAALGG